MRPVSAKKVFELPDLHPEDNPISMIPQSKWYMILIYIGSASLIVGLIFDLYNVTVPFIVQAGPVDQVVSFGAYTLITGLALWFVDEFGNVLMYRYRTKNEGSSDVRQKRDYLFFMEIRFAVWIVVLIFWAQFLSYQIYTL